MLPNSNLIFQTLLYFGEATKIKDIANFLNLNVTETENEKANLQKICNNLGLIFLSTKTTFEIALSEVLTQKIQKERIAELKVELSESALQTLSVVMYKPNSTKAEVDFVRGVDSTRSLKNLQTRGLIEKLELKNRKIYIPTTETLKYLGLENVENIPGQKEISNKLNMLISGDAS